MLNIFLFIYLMSRASNDGKQPVASPPSDHTGFLHKRGHLNTAFKRRFFVLTGAKLSYYEDVTAAHRGRSRGSVTVTRVRHLRPGEGAAMVDDGLLPSSLPFAFHFDTTEKKPFFVYADGMHEKLGWLRALLGIKATGNPHMLPTSCELEDLYREHVSNVVADLGHDFVVEPDGWRCVARGLERRRAGDFDAAQDAFREAANHAGRGDKGLALAALHESAKLHSQRQEYGDALTQFDAALAIAPPEATAPLKLQAAWCSWQIGRGDRAEQLYVTLLEEDPLHVHVLIDRARMAASLSRWSDAHGDLELAFAISSKHATSPELLNDAAVCLYELGRCSEALAMLGEAIERRDDLAAAYINRANVHRKLEALEAAMADHDRAVQLEPENALARGARGACHLHAGRLEAAFVDLEQALRLDPANEAAARNLEVARARQKDAERASGGALSPPPVASSRSASSRSSAGQGGSGASGWSDRA